MKVSPVIRAVTAVAATALALGLAALAAAAPARSARPATAAPAGTHTATLTSSATSAVTVTSCMFSGEVTGPDSLPTGTMSTGMADCDPALPFDFADGGKISVAFSNGISAELVMQGDGNLCWYVTAPTYSTHWCSGTNGITNSYAAWQGDGNLVVYGTNSAGSGAKWSSGTNGKGRTLFLQSDGNLVIYGLNASGGLVALWAAF